VAKKKTTAPIGDDLTPEQSKKRETHKALLKELRERYPKCVEAERENRNMYREDMKFIHVPGEQWDATEKSLRGKDRPMYEFNRMRVTIKNVINQMRARRPSGKVRGFEDSDVDTAEIIEGQIRNIWNQSDGDSVIDYAAEHQVGGGYGAWSISTEYCEDSVYDQDICVESERNPLCLYADFAAVDPMKRDARFWIKHCKYQPDDFKARWPKAEKIAFEPDDELEDDLNDDDGIWVAEYWRKEPMKRVIALLSNGKTVDLTKLATKQKVDVEQVVLPQGVTIALDPKGQPRQRIVDSHKIVQYICSGDAVLEGPNQWAGKEFPFVPVYGDYVVIEGKTYWCGLARYGKDAQRAHNWAMTSVFESIASSPQAKFWATPAQAKGHTGQWAEANAKNFPFMLYNHDPEAPGAPERMGGPDVPAALIQAAIMSGDELKSCTGKFDASLGAVSNETSGRAIRARQDEGDVATYNFADNQSKAVQRTFEILIDLIPEIYDTERSLRILGADGAEKYVRVNQPDPVTGEILNDLSVGKFDVVVTTGPSFATQRMEAAEVYTGLAQADPTLMAVAGDLIIKAHDLPLAHEIAERKRLMLPPQIQQSLGEKGKQSPEVQAALMQAEQAMQQVQQMGQLVQQASEEARGEKSDAEKAKAANQVAAAQIDIKAAQLAVDVANFKTLVAQAEAKAAEKAAAQGNEVEKEQLSAQLAEALAGIQTTGAQLFQEYAGKLAEMHGQALSTAQPQVIVHAPPRARVKHIERQNGKLVPVYEDQVQGVQ
jgi:hypothetical protein